MHFQLTINVLIVLVVKVYRDRGYLVEILHLFVLISF